MTDAKKTVLVVDDEEGLRDVLEMAITRRGYKVVTADGGNAALGVMRSEAVDVVLTDVRMERGSGIELLEALRIDDCLAPPVVLLSAFTDVSPAEGYARGARCILAKPFSIETLGPVIEDALRPFPEHWVREIPPAEVTLKVDLTSLEQAEREGQLQIGHGGIFVATKDRYPTQMRLDFSFSFEEGSPRKLEGRTTVRWHRHTGSSHFLDGLGLELEAASGETLALFKSRLENPSPSFIPLGQKMGL